MNVTPQELADLQATALASVANAVVITDREGTAQWVNAAFTRMSGYPPEEIVGHNPRLLSSGVHTEAFYRQLWDTILAGRVWRGEIVERHRDGYLYTVDQTITPLVGVAGAVTHFVAVHEDISQLRASQERLQALFDLALDAMLLADDDGRYVDANPAACSLLGYTHEELLAMSVADVAADSSPDVVRELFGGFLEQGRQGGAFALRHRTGRVIESEYRASANILPGLHLSVLRDVTEHNASVRALAASEARFRGLAENASDIVAIVHVGDDLNVELDYVNPVAARLFALPVRAGEDRRHDLALSCHPDDLPELHRLLHTATHQPARGMLRFIDGSGGWVVVEALVTETGASEGHRTVQVIARDVTEQQRTRQALQDALDSHRDVVQALHALNATKNQILQNISHELRTPVTVIVGLAELLARPELSLDHDRARDFRARIAKHAARLERLLDDLLDASTTSNDRLRRGTADMANVVRAAVERAQLGARPVAVDLHPVIATVDVDKFGRLVDSLLDNIIRHTPSDTPVVVRLRDTAVGGQLTVEDHGAGIPPEIQQRVFEPLYQGPSAGCDAQPGAGLGLAVVRSIAAAHGGRAWLDASAPGTRIHVTIPKDPQPEKSDLRAPCPAPPGERWLVDPER